MPTGLVPVSSRGINVAMPLTSLLTGAYAIGVLVWVSLVTIAVDHVRRSKALLIFTTAVNRLQPDLVEATIPCGLSLHLRESRAAFYSSKRRRQVLDKRPDLCGMLAFGWAYKVNR